MTDELHTVELTQRQMRSLHSAATMFYQWVEELAPGFGQHVEEDGEPPALTTGIMALEVALMLA
jgi:hypothetical protein